MEQASTDAGGLQAALWSAIDEGADPATLVEATEQFLAAYDGQPGEGAPPAVLVAVAHRLEAEGRRLAEAQRTEEAARVLGAALRAAGSADHLVLATSLLGLREELLVDLGRKSDGLQRHYAQWLAGSNGSVAGNGRAGGRTKDRPREHAGERMGHDAGPLSRAEFSSGVPDRGLPPAGARPPVDWQRARKPAASSRRADDDFFDLQDYLTVLRRHWWLIAATTVLTLAVGLGFSARQTPIYESSARLFIQGDSVAISQAPRQLAPSDQELATLTELITSESVAARAAEKLDGDASPGELLEHVTASRVPETQVLEVAATSPDRQRAVVVAQAFAEAALDYRASQALQQVGRANEAVQQREQELRSRLSEIERQLRNDTDGSQTDLRAEKQRLENELVGLAGQQAALSGSEALAQGGGEIVKPATVPDNPVSPQPLRTGLMALLLGSMLGVGLAFLRDFLDDTVRSEEDAIGIAGVGAVGHIPTWTAKESDRRRLVTLMEPGSPVAEAYRTLRTNVRYLAAGRKVSSLVVTSSEPREGKTTTAGNLAVALADAGLEILLVDADLRNPRVHETIGIDRSPGLMELLVGDVRVRRFDDAAADVVDGLRVIPAGTVPPNPAELLGSRGMEELVDRFEEMADVVIFDSAPILAVADTLELAQLVGMTLLVVDAESSSRRSIEQATERLEGVGSELGGLVLNNVQSKDGHYEGYYSNYYSRRG